MRPEYELTREAFAKLVVSVLSLVIFLWTVLTYAIAGQILGVILLALVLWSLYPRHHFISSVLIIVLLSFFEASLSLGEFINSLFSTYGRSGLWIIITGFILAEAMRTSGLARRIALWIVSELGGDPNRIVASVAIANLAVAPLSPSTTAKAFLILPICTGLIEALGVEKGKSQYGAAVMLMSMAANNICSTGFLTATVPNPISAEYIRSISGLDLGWLTWLRMALPMAILLLAVSWLVCGWMFKPEIKETAEALEHLRSMRKQLGPLSREEKLVAIVYLASLLLWITEGFSRFNAGIISLLFSLIFFLPKIRVLKVGKFAGNVPWGSIMLFAASMFLTRAVSRWKAFDPVALAIFGFLGLSRISPLLYVSLMVLVSMFLHVGFTSTTVYATVMMPLSISLAQLQGLQPSVVAIPIAFLTPIALILPVNTIPNIVFYSSGYFNQKQMLLYGLVVSLLSTVLILTIGMSYWRLLGLI